MLREINEEIGITVSNEQILGCLDEYETRSGFSITSVVLWVNDIPLEAEPGEVEEIFIIDLEELFRADSPKWVSIEESNLKGSAVADPKSSYSCPYCSFVTSIQRSRITGKIYENRSY